MGTLGNVRNHRKNYSQQLSKETRPPSDKIIYHRKNMYQNIPSIILTTISGKLQILHEGNMMPRTFGRRRTAKIKQIQRKVFLSLLLILQVKTYRLIYATDETCERNETRGSCLKWKYPKMVWTDLEQSRQSPEWSRVV